MVFDQADSEYVNNGTITDGAVIAASGVRLINSDGGRIYGGVTFSVGGSTLVNQLGGIVALDDSGQINSRAIVGSSGGDSIDNAGLIRGFIEFGGGNDVLFHRSTASGTYRVDFGAGDDIFRTDSQSFSLELVGGEGRDRFEIESTNYFAPPNSGFEDLVVSGGGWVSGLSGFSTITYGAGASFELDHSMNPLVILAMSGGVFNLGVDSTLGGLTGSDSPEVLRISRGARFEGVVDLGGGNDRFGTATVTLSQAISPFGGNLFGGAGYDEITLGTLDGTPDVIEHRDVDLSRMFGFESLVLDTYVPLNSPRFVADVTIFGARSFTFIVLGEAGRFSLAPAILGGATVLVGPKSEFTIQAGALIGTIGSPNGPVDQPSTIAQGDPALSKTVINHGTISGTVYFDTGDDVYDGRAGSIGGTVFGNAGNDTLLGGDGAERLHGGFGADILEGNGGADVLTGGAGNDLFRGTVSGLNGDTITDLGAGERILFSNAVMPGFTFSLSGSTLTYTGGSLTLANFVGRLSVSAAAGGGVQLSVERTATRNDFNGDGRSDVLWRHDGGLVTDWLATANGGFVNNQANAALAVPTDWQIVGTGDFNGDGRSDILWRHAGGQVTDWLGTASGGFANNQANVANVIPNDWKVAGTGDFNGDGRDDIVWRHDSGLFTSWLGKASGGFDNNHANSAATIPTDWKIMGTGDFNGDGRVDLLWRHDGGMITDWLGTANGGFANNHANAAKILPTEWHIVGTGDFNGDGRDDILFRYDNGALMTWLGQANGGFVLNDNVNGSTVGRDWAVAGIGDYNGDGRDDLLWRHSGGLVTEWLGTEGGGFSNNHANAAASIPLDWKIQSPDIFLF